MKYPTIILLLVCLLACKQLPFGNDPLAEYNEVDHILTVSNFKWGYGTAGLNQFSGDFKTLDKEVFETLKGHSGTCTVSFKNTEKNKYGVDTTATTSIGELNIDELNRYQSWEYWHKAGGIKTLLYEKYIAPQESNKSIDSDTTATDSTEYFQRLKQQAVIPTDSITREPVVFTYAELYPLKEDYDSIAPDGPTYEFEGVVKEVKAFDNGTLVVIEVKKGEFAGIAALLMFYPDKCSEYTASRFLNAAKAGANINAKCVQATKDAFNIVSADIGNNPM